MSMATFILTTTASVFAVLAVSRFFLEWRIAENAARRALGNSNFFDDTFVTDLENESPKNVAPSDRDDWLEISDEPTTTRRARGPTEHDWSF